MSQLFLNVLNMSLKASYVILIVVFVRLLLKKAPKSISYALWIVVAFRLMIPFTLESGYSLMPSNANVDYISHDIIYQQSPQINSGIEVVDSFVSQSLPAPTVGASVNPLQIYTEIGAYIWILGIVVLLIYSIVSVLQLKRQLKSAQLIEQNIFEAQNIKTPFVLGLVRPKIYLPAGLTKDEQDYIILHEQTHIHRKDHIIKMLAFLILSVHWFNPLVWLAFRLMSNDMELSCDERVLKKMDNDIKKPYANSLLSLNIEKHILNGSPLAFGEGNVRARIKNVLNYKKPAFWLTLIAVLFAAVIGIGLLANPKSKSFNENNDGNGTEENVLVEKNQADNQELEVANTTDNSSTVESTKDNSSTIENIADNSGTIESTTDNSSAIENTEDNTGTTDTTTDKTSNNEVFSAMDVYFKDYTFDVSYDENLDYYQRDYSLHGVYDLNDDGEVDKINAVLMRDYKDGGYVEVNGMKVALELDSPSGEMQLIDLDSSDNYTEIAVFDDGPSGDPIFIFFRYDGENLYSIGRIDRYALMDGQGKFISWFHLADNFNPIFFSAWGEFKNNEFVITNHDVEQYIGKTYEVDGMGYFVPLDYNPENYHEHTIWDFEAQREFNQTKIKLLDIHIDEYDRTLNWFYVELPDGEKGLLYFWIGD
jgi:beta-lactamase regulating signal transducer with metallopeptidase domain